MVTRKRPSFRIKRSPKSQQIAFHPLDHDDFSSDSDLESVLDSSYNESILSVTSLDSCCCSILPRSSCRSSRIPTPAVVLTPLVISSPVKPKTMTSHSKLLSLVKQDELKKQQHLNLHKSDMKLRWRSFLLAVMTFAFSPRSTDDFLPLEGPQKCLDRELDTYHCHVPSVSEVDTKCYKTKNRDYRINCNFLKWYALDYAARQNKSLPNSPEDIEQMLRNPSIAQFDEKFGLARISNASREKLWDAVILPPRSDSRPCASIDFASYTYVGQNGFGADAGTSVATKTGNYIPWATHRSSLKPAGKLSHIRPLASHNSPTSSATLTQYTIQGWCNERWISS